RAAVTKDHLLWPGGIIPYVIESSIARQLVARGMIQQAIREIESKTCVRFVPRTTQRDYVSIFNGSGCYSFVGRVGRAQKLSLGDRCHYKGIIGHELLHAVGFNHEHSRSDRDIYVNVFTANVKTDKVSSFKKLKPWENRLLTPFDMKSIMLYGSHSFARAPGLVTILAKDGSRLTEVYDKPGLSASDIIRVNKLYKCSN
ncbi:hypothetical protein MTO96_039922, partial [Rhipicephalus appendiculatus]